jgi:uracil-DNA glycosylase
MRQTNPPAPGESPANCHRCALWKRATQAVGGEGSAPASIMLVGEQPGEQEDLEGRPFVGPAGRLLDDIIGEAGISRGAVYITNAVKHFKWELRGKRRLHKKPGLREITACGVWLEQEIARVAPAVIVALGSTALRALTGASLTVAATRGRELRLKLENGVGPRILASYHPSAILRANGDLVRELRNALVHDLRRARELIQ